LLAPTKDYFEKNLLNIFKARVKLLTSSLTGSDEAILGAAELVTSE
jgi:hypothetical protein